MFPGRCENSGARGRHANHTKFLAHGFSIQAHPAENYRQNGESGCPQLFTRTSQSHFCAFAFSSHSKVGSTFPRKACNRLFKEWWKQEAPAGESFKNCYWLTWAGRQLLNSKTIKFLGDCSTGSTSHRQSGPWAQVSHTQSNHRRVRGIGTGSRARATTPAMGLPGAVLERPHCFDIPPTVDQVA